MRQEIRLNRTSIDKAIIMLWKYEHELPKMLERLEIRLCEEGAKVAAEAFGHNVAYQIKPIANGYALIANGEHICFLEFGTGFYTVDGTYPLDFPIGINVYAGSWSETHAQTFQSWVAANKPEDKYPYNHLPRYGMVKAYEKMRDMVYKVAKEVFDEFK